MWCASRAVLHCFGDARSVSNSAAAVAPTLDGFGPQGSLAHAPEEYIEIPTLVERARVTARFIELWTEKFRRPA